jgi:hypothetical protein
MSEEKCATHANEGAFWCRHWLSSRFWPGRTSRKVSRQKPRWCGGILRVCRWCERRGTVGSGSDLGPRQRRRASEIVESKHFGAMQAIVSATKTNAELFCPVIASAR